MRAPTIEDLCDQFPNSHADDVVAAFDEMAAERQSHLETVADNLPAVVLYSSMSMSDQLRFNALASAGKGVATSVGGALPCSSQHGVVVCVLAVCCAYDQHRCDAARWYTHIAMG